MEALVFGVDSGFVPPEADQENLLLTNLAATPMALQQIPDPVLLGDDWVVLQTRMTGICGSDSKQVFMDTGGDTDFSMTAFISFPQVLGHEVVADVVEVGPAGRGVEVGQRVPARSGISAVAVLGALHPDVEVALVARHPAQQALAARLGATVFDSEQDREDLVVALADWSGVRLLQPWDGLPIAHPGRIDVAYDTLGAPHTVELELRVLAARAVLVVSGVHAAGRYEWSPQYFKEINLVGSNAFGIEEVEGVRRHAIEHYLELVRAGRVDLSGLLIHTFCLADWRDAFTTIAKQHETGAIKVAFDFR